MAAAAPRQRHPRHFCKKHYFRADGRPSHLATCNSPAWDIPPVAWDPKWGRVRVDTAPFSSRVSNTRVRGRTHTHTHTPNTHASTHTRAHPRTQARVRAAGRKLCALVRSLPPPPLRSSRGSRETRGGNREVLGSGETWTVPPPVPRRSLALPSGPWIKTIRTEQSGLDATFQPPRLG